MGKINKTYGIEVKKKAMDLYFNKGMGYILVSRELGINDTIIRRWVKHFKVEGVSGLEEKRGKKKGVSKGRPRTQPEDPEVKIQRLEAENEMLKKLLKM